MKLSLQANTWKWWSKPSHSRIRAFGVAICPASHIWSNPGENLTNFLLCLHKGSSVSPRTVPSTCQMSTGYIHYFLQIINEKTDNDINHNSLYDRLRRSNKNLFPLELGQVIFPVSNDIHLTCNRLPYLSGVIRFSCHPIQFHTTRL